MRQQAVAARSWRCRLCNLNVLAVLTVRMCAAQVGGPHARDMDMQVTFTGGLEELSQRLAAQKKAKAGSATVWESYLQRQRCSCHVLPWL